MKNSDLPIDNYVRLVNKTGGQHCVWRQPQDD